MNIASNILDEEVEGAMKILAEELSNAVREVGVTKTSIARATRRNTNTINNCCAGRNPNMLTVLAVAMSIDVDFRELFGKVGDRITSEIMGLADNSTKTDECLPEAGTGLETNNDVAHDVEKPLEEPAGTSPYFS